MNIEVGEYGINVNAIGPGFTLIVVDGGAIMR